VCACSRLCSNLKNCIFFEKKKNLERVEKLRAGGENASNHQPMASSARRVSTVYSTAKSTASSKTLASVAKPKPAAAVVVAASGQEVADLKQQIAELKLQLSVESAAHRASEEEIQQHHLTIDALKTASQSDQSMISSQQSMISVLKQDLQLSAAKVETLGAQLLASSNTIAARERQIAALELSHQKSIAQLQQTLQQSQETLQRSTKIMRM
jgi:chromosome segregation ATPase